MLLFFNSGEREKKEKIMYEMKESHWYLVVLKIAKEQFGINPFVFAIFENKKLYFLKKEGNIIKKEINELDDFFNNIEKMEELWKDNFSV
ncbi:MAG: hypothetical protein V1891_04385 [bacterium]